MSCKIEFLVNSKIEIEMEDGMYKSNIQDVTDDCIGISIPVSNGKYLPLGRKEKVTVVYYYGKDIYRFDTMVLGRKVDKILIIILKKPEKVTMYQRRGCVRVPFMVNVYCAQIKERNPMENICNNEVDFFQGYSLDISGGGIKLAFDRNIEKKIHYGDVLMVTIPTDESDITVKAKVSRLEKDRKNPKIICGLSFIDLDKTTGESIIRLVFHIMRQQMKNGVKED